MSGENQFDVIIIGGGIGGLSLSIQSALAGFKTAVFEKEKYPFHKVCGEYISNESRGYLLDCGIAVDDPALPKIRLLTISDIHGQCFDFPLDTGGFGISRYRIDNALFEAAKKSGVEVFSGRKVNGISFENDTFSISANDAVYYSKTAVAASGKRSNIDLKMKRKFAMQKLPKDRNYLGIKYHLHYDLRPERIELHNFSNGYCGISKIEDNKCCLCYLTTAENLSNNNNSIKEMEENVLFENPRLRSIFSRAEFLFNEPVAISQISFEKRSQVEQHVLMIGDAAGLISPLCGNGMSMAMQSGKIAFQNIRMFLNGQISRQTMEENYARQWQKTFGRRMFVGRNIQKLFGNNYTTSQFLKLMQAVPSLSNYLIRQTHGRAF